jgi:VWFA-related protein
MRCFLLNPGSAARLGAGLAYLSILAATASAALSQTPVLKTRTKEEREERAEATHRITLNVQVADSLGNPIADLNATDFKLYDNRQSRKIVSFHAIDGQALADATEIMIVLDAVNSPEQTLDAEKSAIFKYLAQSRKPFTNPTAFALWFNGHLTATEAKTDRNAIGRAFVKMTKGLHSNACNSEENLVGASTGTQKVAMTKGDGKVDFAKCRAVHFRDSLGALDSIAQKQSIAGGRTLLIWVGPGWPNTSAETQRIDPKQQQDLAQEFVMLLHDFRVAQMTVYSVATADPTQQSRVGIEQGPALVNVSEGSSPIARLTVPEFARRTGGQTIAASDDIAAGLKKCMRDAEWYYAVTFNAPPAQNGAGELHSLEVQVNRPGVEIRTMNSYYSEP